MSILQESLIEFKKAGYTSNVTSGEPTEEEMNFIRTVVSKIVDKSDEKMFENVYKAFTDKWTAYKKTLVASAPSSDLTKEEEDGIKKLIVEYGLSEEAMSILQESLTEFKKSGYLSNVTNEKVTEEEMTYIRNVVSKIVDKSDEKLFENVYNAFIEKLMAYKKNLMQG